MFDKIKAANQLRKMQSDLLKQTREIFHTGEKGRYKVVVRGDKMIEKIEFDGVEDKILKEVINDAMKEVEKKVEKKSRGQASELMNMLGMAQ
jgi:DNA-binding protein YbaB